MINAIEKYNRRATEANSLVCIGLDSDMEHLPERFRKLDMPQFAFNRHIIEQTYEFTAAYKLNTAFYEARGEQGWQELRLTVEYLWQQYSDVLTICDAKRGDIGNTAEAYARAVFDVLRFDAVTLNPYLGHEAMIPFLRREEKGCIILCRTSNSGAGELQDLFVQDKPLWHIVAEKAAHEWNQYGNCMLVVGATYPDEIQQVRALTGNMTLLIPGIGAQGGDVERVIAAGVNSLRLGMIINSSRSIIFADNPHQAAHDLRDTINRYRS